MLNLPKKIIVGALIIIFVFIILKARQNNQTVIPDLSNDKDAREISLHILSSNSWFTCPDVNIIASWMRNFIKSGKVGVGSNFTKENYITLFKDNPLYWACLVVNVKDYINK